jgi:predicted nucleic acid-binding protein
VYAHFQKFSDRIENYIKKEQYKIENFEVEVYPSKDELPVSKKELIAYSGRTGGFMGPHLHFEIRDSKTERTINPLYFGININDSKKPTINTVIGYSLDSISQINQINEPSQLTVVKDANDNLIANKIYAYGKIGFGINAYDQLDDATNKNGIYSLELFVNGQKVHEFKADEFAFYESNLINILIDYKRYQLLNQRIQKCFNQHKNNLSLTKNSLNNGIVTIEDGLNYTIEIVAKDFKGNEQKITIPITGKKENIIAKKQETATPYKIKSEEFNEFTNEFAKVAFPKNTFFNDFYLNFEVKNNIVKVHTPIVPLANNYTLTFDVSTYSEAEKNQLYIASISEKGRKSYETTIKKSNTFYTSIKKLGEFTLLTDYEKPIISLYNFKNDQWLSNHNNIKVKILDRETGVKSFRGEIDGKWILMEYDVTTGLLTYDFKDITYTEAKHNLKIVVIDNVGNLSTLEATFYRKK